MVDRMLDQLHEFSILADLLVNSSLASHACAPSAPQVLRRMDELRTPSPRPGITLEMWPAEAVGREAAEARPHACRRQSRHVGLRSTRRRQKQFDRRENVMRKNHTTLSHLPTCVARCDRNSLRATATRPTPPTPRKCPATIEIRPAHRLWYVQRIVFRQHVLR